MNENKLNSLIAWVGTKQSLIVHTIFFIFMMCLPLFGVSAASAMLFLTTVVSLEAIYLNIFIQMGVNRGADEQQQTRIVLSSVQETIEDIGDDVQEIMEDDENEQKTTPV